MVHRIARTADSTVPPALPQSAGPAHVLPLLEVDPLVPPVHRLWPVN
jgi:hypothetical protein